MGSLKIKKNDMVQVIAGKYKGKISKVLQVFPKDQKVLVEGVNIVKKHQKPRKQGDKGGIIEITKPFHVCKVMLVDPKSNKPTRVGIKVLKNNKKTRISKKTGEEL